MSNPTTNFSVGGVDLSNIFQPYTSTTWTQQTSAGSRLWYAITSSSDGTMLAALVVNYYIFT